MKCDFFGKLVRKYGPLLELMAVAGVFCLATSLLPVRAQIYESVDEGGAREYSDISGGKELKLPPVNVMPAAKPMQLDFDPRQASSQVKYSSLEVLSPVNDTTVHINAANLPIEVRLMPPVRRDLGHRLLILLDGESIAENQSSYVLGDADRGTHVISAQVVDENGKAVISSEPVIVHIHKP